MKELTNLRELFKWKKMQLKGIEPGAYLPFLSPEQYHYATMLPATALPMFALYVTGFMETVPNRTLEVTR